MSRCRTASAARRRVSAGLSASRRRRSGGSVRLHGQLTDDAVAGAGREGRRREAGGGEGYTRAPVARQPNVPQAITASRL
jgi:hypothetical protein